MLLKGLSAARAPPLRTSRILPRWDLAPCTINRRLGPIDIVPQEASEKSCGPESFRTAAEYAITAVVLMQNHHEIPPSSVESVGSAFAVADPRGPRAVSQLLSPDCHGSRGWRVLSLLTGASKRLFGAF